MGFVKFSGPLYTSIRRNAWENLGVLLMSFSGTLAVFRDEKGGRRAWGLWKTMPPSPW